MKRHFIRKKLIGVLAALLTVSAIPSVAAQEASLTFEGKQLTIHAPGQSEEFPDLFGGFTGMMPGDERKESLVIRNQSQDFDSVKIYLRAIPVGEGEENISKDVSDALRQDARKGNRSEAEYMNEFLSRLTLRLETPEGVVANTPADVPVGSDQPVRLAELKAGESTNLDMTLKVPVELTNEYADRIAEIRWEFLAEGFHRPTPPKQPDDQWTVRVVWIDDGVGRPDSIDAVLYEDGVRKDCKTVSSEMQWTHTWDKLDPKREYSVSGERLPEDYSVSYRVESRTTIITLEKKKTPDKPGKDKPDKPGRPVPGKRTSIKAVKRWEDNGENRPDSVKLTLYDGERAVETVTLNDDNEWTYVWRDLDASHYWQVIETDVAKGYTPSYRWKDGVLTVTNTASLIHTGQLKWPVLALGGGGIVLSGIGWFFLRRNRKDGQ